MLAPKVSSTALPPLRHDRLRGVASNEASWDGDALVLEMLYFADVAEAAIAAEEAARLAAIEEEKARAEQLKAEQKAARDARYAARKARK